MTTQGVLPSQIRTFVSGRPVRTCSACNCRSRGGGANGHPASLGIGKSGMVSVVGVVGASVISLLRGGEPRGGTAALRAVLDGVRCQVTGCTTHDFRLLSHPLGLSTATLLHRDWSQRSESEEPESTDTVLIGAPMFNFTIPFP